MSGDLFSRAIQRVAAEAVDVLHLGGEGLRSVPHWPKLTDRPVVEERSIASIS